MRVSGRTTRAQLLAGVATLATLAARAQENIDPNNDGSQYAYQENQGWCNAEPSGNGGPGVKVTSSTLTGYVWGENVGWINMSCANNGTCGSVSYGVTNNGAGNLAGYGWAENAGWVSFSCANDGTCATVNYGVQITSTGVFTGNAWGENLGWITWSDSAPYAYQVQTSWPSPGAVPDGNLVPGVPLKVVKSATPGSLDLTWGASCGASDITDYTVYEGAIATWYSHGSVDCSTGGATADTIAPGAGSRYYLVVPVTGLYEGSYGTDSLGNQRPAGSPACSTYDKQGPCP